MKALKRAPERFVEVELGRRERGLLPGRAADRRLRPHPPARGPLAHLLGGRDQHHRRQLHDQPPDGQEHVRGRGRRHRAAQAVHLPPAQRRVGLRRLPDNPGRLIDGTADGETMCPDRRSHRPHRGDRAAAVSELERGPRWGRCGGWRGGRSIPSAEGWEKVAYRRGDILDRGSLAALFDGADVAVHLAFAIFGGREETRADQPRGEPQRLRSGVAAGVERLVYASSVAAYGFHRDNPQPLTEEVPARGSESFYYSAQKAELEAALDELARRERRRRLRLPALHRRRAAGDDADRAVVGGVRLGDPLPALRRGLAGCRCAPGAARRRRPDPARPPRRRRPGAGGGDRGRRPARRLQPRRRGRGRVGDVAARARLALGPGPGPAVGLGAGVARRLTFVSPELEWATALRTPVLTGHRQGAARARVGQPRTTPGRPSARRSQAPAKRACSISWGGRGCRYPSPELTSPPLRSVENLLRASRAKDRLHIAHCHSSARGRRRRPARAGWFSGRRRADS